MRRSGFDRVSGLAFVLSLIAWGMSDRANGQQITPENRDKAPDGKEVDAIDGDHLLRNKHLTAVVAQAVRSRQANMTTRSVAGTIIDLAANGTGGDQLGAFYPGRRSMRYSQLDRQTSDNGSTVTVKNDDGSVTVNYSLAPESHGVRVETIFQNNSTESQTVKLEDEIRCDGGKERMVKNPNGEVDVVWIEDRFWGQAYGVISEHGRIRSNNNARESILRYLVDGATTRSLAAGESFKLVRWVFPGRNLLDVRAAIAAHRKQQVSRIAIQLQSGDRRPIPDALVLVRGEGMVYGTGRTDKNGVLAAQLPAGTYSLKATVSGHTLADETPIRVGTVDRFLVQCPNYHSGILRTSITANDGSPIPCKVELRPREGTTRPDFGPETAEFGVRNVLYSPNGEIHREIPAGEYDVIISHGPEYDAVFTQLNLRPGKVAQLRHKLIRTVKTPGWISCDYHSHSSPSGDNTGSQLGRVLNLAAEHIEFAPCTEHNRVSTYAPHIKSQKLEAFLATVSGMELTGSPLPLNHQNVFPMVHRPWQQDGGGPRTDVSPEKQIERLAVWDSRSQKVIQQNHPDIGWLFYDKNGDGKPDAGFERSFAHIDVMEIHPVTSILKLEPYNYADGKPVRNNCVFNWLQLLNQGYRIYGIVNTDAHYNYHGSGWLRNWIKSSTDDPAKVDVNEMVTHSESGMLIMSNGPYLEATLSDGQASIVSGQEFTVPGGRLQAHIRVQCANWLDIDQVFVLVNGRKSAELTFTRKDNPQMFADGVVKFDRKVPIVLEDDAHIIVATGHSVRKLGPVMGPRGSQRIAAFTNPMFVNVRGEEFTPNKDTLGHPLPVKKQP